MKLTALISTFALAGIFFGCGKKASDTVDALNGFLNDPTGDITNNVWALAENQSDTMDEIASSLNESGSGGSAASALALTPATPKSKSFSNGNRTCTAANGEVTVVITYTAGQKEISEKRGRIPAAATAVRSEVAGTGTLTRIWTPTNAADAVCTNGAHFKFKGEGKTGADIAGTKLRETEARSREMNVSKAGKTLTGRTMATSGTRDVTFKATTDTANFSYEKEINNVMQRTITLKKPDGSTLERIKAVTTPTKLLVKVKRNAATGELEKKVVSAGVIQLVVAADNTKVATEFENLTYNFLNNDNPCTPTEGKIKGKTFKSEQEVKAYEINYGVDTNTFPSGISIALGTEAAVDCPTCVVAKCDFE
ncbi:MAG: hypothetical protein FJY29_11180 [Betaproteobacteria bacterium]|nr:hypothetical protein [Betaproteobacteria bacterium]